MKRNVDTCFTCQQLKVNRKSKLKQILQCTTLQCMPNRPQRNDLTWSWSKSHTERLLNKGREFITNQGCDYLYFPLNSHRDI